MTKKKKYIQVEVVPLEEAATPDLLNTNLHSARGRGRETVGEAMMKSAARAIGSQIGRQIIRGVLGSLLGGRR